MTDEYPGAPDPTDAYRQAQEARERAAREAAQQQSSQQQSSQQQSSQQAPDAGGWPHSPATPTRPIGPVGGQQPPQYEPTIPYGQQYPPPQYSAQQNPGQQNPGQQNTGQMNPDQQYARPQSYGPPQGGSQEYGPQHGGSQFSGPPPYQGGQYQAPPQSQGGQFSGAQFSGAQFSGQQPPGQQFPGGPGVPGAWNPAGSPQPQPQPKKSRLVPVLIAAGVVVALVLATVIYQSTRGKSTANPSPSAGTSAPVSPTAGTSSSPPVASDSPSPSASDEPAAAVKAPGSGTVSTVIARLTSNGFSCSDEQLKGFVSKYCTHYTGSPIMAAYVGGNADGSLGRLATYYMGPASQKPASALSLQSFFIQQFTATAADAAKVQAAVRKGTADKAAKISVGDVSAEGDAWGSVILKMSGWTPDATEPTIALAPSVLSLSSSLTALGYKCSDGQHTTCTYTEPTTKAVATVYYYADIINPNWIELRMKGANRSKTLAGYDKVAPKFFALFKDSAYFTQFSKQNAHSWEGASTLRGSLLYEAWSGNTSVFFHVGQSCWTDWNEWC